MSQATKPKIAPRIVVLTPDAFAADWIHRPSVEAAIGLRHISQNDIAAARNEANREATGFYAEHDGRKVDTDLFADIFNDKLMEIVVARATCKPNDMGTPYFEYADATVPRALTPAGIRRLWDEYVILDRGTAVTLPASSDDEVKALGRKLSRIPPDELDDEVRKLCAHIAERLAGLVELPDDEPEEDDEGDDGMAVYQVSAG
jgi:hypothetical protein